MALKGSVEAVLDLVGRDIPGARSSRPGGGRRARECPGAPDASWRLRSAVETACLDAIPGTLNA